MAECIAVTLNCLSRDKEEDRRKRLHIKALYTFDGTLTKCRRCWESIDKYFTIHQSRVPDDETKIYSLGTFLRGQAADCYTDRKSTMETLHLNDNWVAFAAAM